MLVNLLKVAFGIAVLAAGGEAVIRGALGAAKRLGVSPMMAGLVIVGFGTSAPELVVSVDAAASKQPGIALGNVIGSNIGNILLILGCCALIRPLSISRRLLIRDGVVALSAAIVFIMLALGSGLTRVDGVVMIVLLGVYLAWAYWSEVKGDSRIAAVHAAEADEVQLLPRPALLIVLCVVGGLFLLIGGSRLTLAGALGLGQALGVPSAVIGLTVVAVGTSLPEFTVSVLATLRRHADVAVGNILGSNIFNTLGILGISATLQTLSLEGRMSLIDQWVMLGSTVVLLAFLTTGHRVSRIEGGILLIAYLVYSAAIFAFPTA
ncbi:MAG: calcium/sodium antiporter [Woeseiaceae bacterium]|nr:calcium/sodium antiporter [Woeseiaceae bacterium]